MLNSVQTRAEDPAQELPDFCRMPQTLEVMKHRLLTVAAFIAIFGNAHAQSGKNDEKMPVHGPSYSKKIQPDAPKTISIPEKKFDALLDEVKALRKDNKEIRERIPAPENRNDPVSRIGRLIEGSPVDLFLALLTVAGTAYGLGKAWMKLQSASSHESCTGHVLTKGKKGVVLLGNIQETSISTIWENPLLRKHIHKAEKRAKKEPGFPFLRFKSTYAKQILSEVRGFVSAHANLEFLEKAGATATRDFAQLQNERSRILLPKGVERKDPNYKNQRTATPDDIIIAISYEEMRRTQARIVQMPLGNVPVLLLNLDKWLAECQTDKNWVMTNVELALSVMNYPYQNLGHDNRVEVMCKSAGAENIWEETRMVSNDLRKLLVVKKDQSEALLQKYLDGKAKGILKRDPKTQELLDPDFHLSEKEQEMFEALWVAKPTRTQKLMSSLTGKKTEDKPYRFAAFMWLGAD